MKYLLINRSGSIKEYNRMPNSINPRDVLIEVSSKAIVNHVLSLKSGVMEEDNSEIADREEAIAKAKKLDIL